MEKILDESSVNEALRPCLKILNALKVSKFSWPFKDPVDPAVLGIPNYFEIIKEPMDLTQIENKLRGGVYATGAQFHADISKIISNSYTFNLSNPEFIKLTSDFERSYHRISADFKALPEISQKPPQNISKAQKKKKKQYSMHLRDLNESQPVTLG